MKLASLNRWQAAAIHLALSVLVAATAIAVIVWLWYPPPWFNAMGGRDLLVILVSVDITIGPILTLVVFNPQKKELKIDLAIIGALQLAALIYGAWVVFNARPAYVVFVQDHFDVVPANEITQADLDAAPEELRSLPLTGPRVVGARVPTDPDERQKLMFSALAGRDVQNIPKYFVPYADVAEEATKSAKTLGELLKKHPGDAEALRAAALEAGRPESVLLYVPVRARLASMTAILDSRDGRLASIAAVDPY